jgi:cyclopropane fatty-acyl-phospholipid synthase-like methyltransferase
MPPENEWRTFSPKKALARLGLKKGMFVADLGCG